MRLDEEPVHCPYGPAGGEATMAKRTAATRELINTGTDKRYVRRDHGRFKESDDVNRSLAQDRRRKAKARAKPGQRDRGDK